MTPSHLHWLAYLALCLSVSLLLLTRSRSVPALRPAARACVAFVALDGARLAIDVGGRGGWCGYADVVLFLSLPMPWAWLLCDDGTSPLPLLRQKDGTPGPPPDVQRGADKVGSLHMRERGTSEAVRPSPRSVRDPHCGVERGQRRRRAVVLALLAYSALLLIFRHPLAHHWDAALQAPRLVTGAWALWVGMRGKDEERGPLVSAPRSSSRAVCMPPSGKRYRGPYHLPPSLAIGIALSLSAAASVVGGLWWDWTGVRLVSAAGWILAAVLGWLEESTGGSKKDP